jgi:3-deoxy-D-manno-octulosonate 8-phosphate phosphatase (KDO 8-P phosphatase)
MAALKAIELDLDGVLTGGGVWWGPNGEEWKRFSFADIMADTMGVLRACKAGALRAFAERNQLGRTKSASWATTSTTRPPIRCPPSACSNDIGYLSCGFPAFSAC